MFNPAPTRFTAAPLKVDHLSPDAVPLLSERLTGLLNQELSKYEVVVVCIGTDRSTGDSLGPLVGSQLTSKLKEFNPLSRVKVYGTLETPVHAVNLKQTIDEIQASHLNPFIIAVDACLGQLSSVGLVTLAEGPLKPGAGVNKDLPEVGDIHMTGIVNVGGFMEYFVLQNTRLSVVMRMADCISMSLLQAIKSSVGQRPKENFYLRIR